ncbi:phosphatidate cytidylyltransferase [Candidatus Sumerlaeota bacterium]|nr:phosphatidate cytidylyltransferase [Candidatus Sumerlaeota bacterium]
MAFHRTITGIVIALLIILSVFIPSLNWILKIILMASAFIGIYEYQYLTYKKEFRHSSLIACLFTIALLIDAVEYDLGHLLEIAIAALTLNGIQIIFSRDPKGSIGGAATVMFGGLYIGLPMGLGLIILKKPEGYLLLGMLLAINFFTDIGAYVIGSSFGKHKLCPHISPKKTVEGSIGGFIFAVGAALICHLIFYLMKKSLFSLPEILGLGAFFGMASQMGDLMESIYKRDAGVKDSGWIIPGHGGVLDRIDSLLFTLPLMYLYLVIFPG